MTGIARDVAKILPRELSRIEKKLKKIFELVTFLVIESDSKDNTTKVLNDIKNGRNNFDYKSLGKIESILPNRIQRLAFCRNVYVKEIRENKPSQILAGSLRHPHNDWCDSLLDW